LKAKHQFKNGKKGRKGEGKEKWKEGETIRYNSEDSRTTQAST
jgi:hypothetical protein